MSRCHAGVSLLRGGVAWRRGLAPVLVLAASTILISSARATVFTWKGGSIFGNTSWNDSGNWTPDQIDISGFPDGTNDKATVNTSSFDAHLDASRNIGDLAISNGGDVFLNGFQLNVNSNSGAGRIGETFVGGGSSNSRLVVGSATLDTDLLTIDNDGSVGVTGGLVQVDVGAGIAAGGTFSGRGTLQFPSGNGGLTNLGTVRTNSGNLVISRTGGGGDFEQNGGALTADDGDLLRVSMPTVINGGTTTARPGATLRFDQATTLNGGTINILTNGEMLLNGATNWAGVNINNFIGTKTGIVRQNGTSTVSSSSGLGVRVYDLDGVGVNSATTIQAGATLQLKVDFIDADSTGVGNNGYEGSLTIADTGRLEVNTSEGSWVNQFSGTIMLQGMPVAEPEAVVGGTDSLTNIAGATIEGNGTFEVDVNNANGGIIRPGVSAGVLNFKEDLTLESGGTLEIELMNHPINAFDQIFVGGDATLGGTLDVMLNSFIETDGLEFKIIDIAGTRGGTFDGLAEGSYVGTNGKDVYITYQGGDGNDVVLFTSPGFAGDYNNNGIVDAADYTMWRNNVGQPPGTLPNDVDGGVIGPAQYATWKANFGAVLTVPGSGAVSQAAVPEPSLVVLLAGWVVGRAFTRRGRAANR